MAERILDPAIAHASELVVQRHEYGGTGLDRAFPGGIGIRNIQMEGAACAVKPCGRFCTMLSELGEALAIDASFNVLPSLE